jgi:hypothetical protein
VPAACKIDQFLQTCKLPIITAVLFMHGDWPPAAALHSNQAMFPIAEYVAQTRIMVGQQFFSWRSHPKSAQSQSPATITTNLGLPPQSGGTATIKT